MWIFSFYRFYCSLAVVFLCRFLVYPSWWLAVGVGMVVRIAWSVTERLVERYRVDRLFSQYRREFKDTFGPYGIRLINKAEKDRRIKSSLVEVFEPNPEKLKKNVEQMEVMETLFNAGMQPQGDDFLLHDLKLKFGRHRLEKLK